MAIAVSTHGSQAATPGTTHTLYTSTSGGETYVLSVNAASLDAGSTIIFKLKTKVRASGAGSTAAVAYQATYSNALVDPVILSLPTPAPHYFSATLQLTTASSTGLSFPWAVMTL